MELKRILLTTALLASILYSSCSSIKKESIKVPISDIRYSNGQILVSSGFTVCSAVILDYENQAVMAHITPSGSLKDKKVTANNVVEYLVNEFKMRGVDPQKSEAIISAGVPSTLDDIVRELKERGITVRRGMVDAYIRDIIYNPINDNLDLKSH